MIREGPAKTRSNEVCRIVKDRQGVARRLLEPYYRTWTVLRPSHDEVRGGPVGRLPAAARLKDFDSSKKDCSIEPAAAYGLHGDVIEIASVREQVELALP